MKSISILHKILFNLRLFKKVKQNKFNYSSKISSDPNHSVKFKFEILTKQTKKENENENIKFDDLLSLDNVIEGKIMQKDNEKEVFFSNAKTYFAKVENAFFKIDDENVMIEVRDETILSIKAGKVGNYIFKIDEEMLNISFTSPVSGYFKYTLNQTSGFWENIKDQHILDDLLIREFCKHSKGLLIIE